MIYYSSAICCRTYRDQPLPIAYFLQSPAYQHNRGLGGGCVLRVNQVIAGPGRSSLVVKGGRNMKCTAVLHDYCCCTPFEYCSNAYLSLLQCTCNNETCAVGNIVRFCSFVLGIVSILCCSISISRVLRQNCYDHVLYTPLFFFVATGILLTEYVPVIDFIRLSCVEKNGKNFELVF